MSRTIWYISKYFAPETDDSTGSRGWLLMKEFAKQGYKPIVFCSDSNNLVSLPKLQSSVSLEEKQGVSLIWLRTLKYSVAKSVLRIFSWIHFEWNLFWLKKSAFTKPDVIIVSSLSLLSILNGLILKKKYSCRLVFEIRDIWPLTMVEEANFSKWHPLVLIIEFLEKFGYKNSDLIVGTMPKLDLHIKNVIRAVKPFHCSPLGFDPDNYLLEDHNENPLFNNIIPEDKFIVGYAGSLGITNALEPFISSIKLMQENNKIHFVIVGGGDFKDKFMKDLENNSNVSFLERIAQSEVKYFLKMCDLLYLSTKPSKVWEYGQSMNKVVEYMLSGKPILANYSGFPSMINESNCGLFVKTTNPVEIKKQILKISSLSKKERIQLGQNGKNWMLQNRTYSLLAKDYLNAINLSFKRSIT